MEVKAEHHVIEGSRDIHLIDRVLRYSEKHPDFEIPEWCYSELPKLLQARALGWTLDEEGNRVFGVSERSRDKAVECLLRMHRLNQANVTESRHGLGLVIRQKSSEAGEETEEVALPPVAYREQISAQSCASTVAYLAQHGLLDEVMGLRKDEKAADTGNGHGGNGHA